jgi:hypothetical protein
MKHICELCKKTFQAPPSQKARFCSRDCYDKSREGWFKCDFCGSIFRYYKSHKKGKRVFCSKKCHWDFIKKDITNHPNWRGKGYRKIIEKAIGRKLKSSEIIHHINGDHCDNRLENLKITDRVEHPKLHPESGYQKGHKQFNSGRTWFKSK